MKIPVILVWIVILLVPCERSVAEECQYPIKDADGGDRSLTLTGSQFLQSPVDRNANFASVHAALLDFEVPNPDIRYLTVNLTVQLLLESASDAEAAGKDHNPVVPKGYPLVVNFTDDTSLILTSWGMGVGRGGGGAPIAEPGRFGNDTDFFRVSRSYMGAYVVDEDQRAVLMAKPVKRLQMTTAQGDHDATVTLNRSDRIQFVLGCI